MCLVFPQHYLCVIVVGNRVYYRESWKLLSLSIKNHLLSYIEPMSVVEPNVNSNDHKQLYICNHDGGGYWLEP